MSQGRSFLSNFSFTLALNLFIKLFWVFGIEIAVQNSLGTEAYGRYFEAFNFSYLFFILLDLGISNYNNRSVAGDPEKIKEFFPLMMSMKLGLSLIYLILLYATALLLNYPENYRYLIMFVGLNQVLLSMLLFLRSNIGGLHLFRLDAVISILDRLLMGLICATLIWLPQLLGELSIKSFVLAQTIGYLLAVLLALVSVWRQGVGISLRWNAERVRHILERSLPFALLFFLMGMYTRIDSVMLGRLLPDGAYQAGLYASAFRILDASLIFTVLLSNLLLPMFSRMIAQRESVAQLVRESYKIVWIALTILCSAAFFYAEELYPLMYSANADEGSRLFGLLMLNFGPMALGYVFGTLLTANGSMRLLNIVSLLGLLVNIIANTILIPIHGAFGAVVATLVTQSLVTGINFYMSRRKFDLRLYDFLNWRVLSYVVVTVLLMGIPTVLDLDMHWVMTLVIGTLLAIMFSMVFGLFRLNDLRTLMKVRSSGNANDSKA